MAYISYKDVPLYFGTSADGVDFPTEADGGNKGVICQQLQLNYTPNLSAVRTLGKKPTKDNFNLSGPPNASLSFTAYVETGEFNVTGFTGDVGNIGATFRIGDSANGISGSGAFLTSYSFTLAAYQPVLVQADFAIYNPLTISTTGGSIASVGNNDVVDDLDFSKYGHGAYSTVQTGDLNSLETIESLQYQYSINRLPVYTLGSYNPSVVEVLSEEQTLQIQGDNIVNLVPLTGSNPGPITGTVKDSNSSGILEVVVDGRITAENISIQGGDLARGSITITELLK
tara:strand:+ start:859 stop:1713 length:855 start_codon:yes stop_codon:yes gene_type:complete